MKKLMIVLLAVLMLTACGTKKEQKEEVVLTYANWNLGTEEENNLERQMIAAFEEKHPNIKIEIDETVSSGDYREALTNAAAAGTLPDVFMIDNIPFVYSNDWLLGLNDLVKKDKDFEKVSDAVKDSATIEDQLIAVPAGQFMAGYMINKDLFEEGNLPAFADNYSVEDLDKAIRTLTDLDEGVLGLANEQNMLEWYPAVLNDEYKWYTFDGEKFNLDSEEFKTTLKVMKEYANNFAFDPLDFEVKEELAGQDEVTLWKEGDIAVFYGGSWLAPDFKELSFDWEYVGLPNNKNVLVNDYMGISKETKHADEAYEFAKWMTFSKEGMMKRIELAKENDLVWGSLPLINDQELLDAYFEWNDIPGMKEAYANLDNAIVEANKTMPGYVEARWEASTGVALEDKENASIGDLLYYMVRMDVNPDDYLEQMNQLANDTYQEAFKAMKAE